MSQAPYFRPEQIVSGGQTGVDRGALDVAIALGIPHGGWCPKGRLAEDGRIPARYQLVETESSDYPVRTERNVLDSDATLILFCSQLSGGTELTLRLAERHAKPWLAADLRQPTPPLDAIRRWLSECRPKTLNIAGPRESQCPGVAAEAAALLTELFGAS